MQLGRLDIGQTTRGIAFLEHWGKIDSNWIPNFNVSVLSVSRIWTCPRGSTLRNWRPNGKCHQSPLPGRVAVWEVRARTGICTSLQSTVIYRTLGWTSSTHTSIYRQKRHSTRIYQHTAWQPARKIQKHNSALEVRWDMMKRYVLNKPKKINLWLLLSSVVSLVAI